MAAPVSDFQKEIEQHNFELNKFTIIRLEALLPLPKEFLAEVQQGKGSHTTQLGRFSWTTFQTWQKALEFYLAYSNYLYYGYPIIATPEYYPGYIYETLMNHHAAIARTCQIGRIEIPAVAENANVENQ